jgi:hypothetical protein
MTNITRSLNKTEHAQRLGRTEKRVKQQSDIVPALIPHTYHTGKRGAKGKARDLRGATDLQARKFNQDEQRAGKAPRRQIDLNPNSKRQGTIRQQADYGQQSQQVSRKGILHHKNTNSRYSVRPHPNDMLPDINVPRISHTAVKSRIQTRELPASPARELVEREQRENRELTES